MLKGNKAIEIVVAKALTTTKTRKKKTCFWRIKVSDSISEASLWASFSHKLVFYFFFFVSYSPMLLTILLYCHHHCSHRSSISTLDVVRFSAYVSTVGLLPPTLLLSLLNRSYFAQVEFNYLRKYLTLCRHYYIDCIVNVFELESFCSLPVVYCLELILLW